MKKIIGTAYAKLNLMLKVIGRREDGYHNLQMINAKINLFDIVTISKINKDDIYVFFEPRIVVDENNIVLKIASFMKKKFDIPGGMKIEIKKNIPIGAGLGGGSADGAIAIHLIDELYNLQLTIKSKEEIGILFGADIPYCLYDKLAIVEGVGDKISQIDYHLPYDVLIVYPNQNVSTKEVFKNVNLFSKSIDLIDLLKQFKKGQAVSIMDNDLTKVTTEFFPVINTIINELMMYPVEKVMMSGSGSTVFALIKPENSKDIIQDYQQKHPDFYIALHQFL